MNNDNSNLEPVQNSVEVPEVGAPISPAEASSFQTIDPTADFQTVDPTATEVLAPSVPLTPQPVAEEAEELAPTETVVPRENEVELLTGTATKDTKPPFDPAKIAPPKATPVNMSSTNVGSARYNPVTGEEMDVNNVLGKGETNPEPDAVNNDEKLKKVEVDPQANKKANTIMLIFFFIALILFVVFLPNIQEMIAFRLNGKPSEEVITTGTLICKLETNTVNLDRNITREFAFTDSKLQSAKFTTVIRGSATLDAEALDSFNDQCVQIHKNVENMNGITVNCDYKDGKLTEKETFDYSIYSADEVSAAYTEAGGSILEFKFEQDLDQIMVNMRQGGFTCYKEK